MQTGNEAQGMAQIPLIFRNLLWISETSTDFDIQETSVTSRAVEVDRSSGCSYFWRTPEGSNEEMNFNLHSIEEVVEALMALAEFRGACTPCTYPLEPSKLVWGVPGLPHNKACGPRPRSCRGADVL